VTGSRSSPKARSRRMLSWSSNMTRFLYPGQPHAVELDGRLDAVDASGAWDGGRSRGRSGLDRSTTPRAHLERDPTVGCRRKGGLVQEHIGTRSWANPRSAATSGRYPARPCSRGSSGPVAMEVGVVVGVDQLALPRQGVRLDGRRLSLPGDYRGSSIPGERICPRPRGARGARAPQEVRLRGSGRGPEFVQNRSRSKSVVSMSARSWRTTTQGVIYESGYRLRRGQQKPV